MLTLGTQAGILSKRTALANMRKYLDYGDLDDEMAQIKTEQDADAARETAQQVAVVQAKPQPTQSQITRNK